jgi:hypothetical protein
MAATVAVVCVFVAADVIDSMNFFTVDVNSATADV